LTTFGPIFVPRAVRDAVSDDAWIAAMLDAERALAAAESKVGVIPAESAAAIAEACTPGDFDLGAILEQARVVGNPAEPLVRALRTRVGEEAARWVHFGATSQDVIDTAAMLVARNAVGLVAEELDAAAAACAALAEAHRDTPMAGRTLLQQAVPITFGAKAAGWLLALVESLEDLRSYRFLAQLGGAAGTLAALGDRGPDVLQAYAAELELHAPILPWHTSRRPWAMLGALLDAGAGGCAKIGLDVVLLSQTEVREVAEADGGRSSTMPHKRNPVAAISAAACAAQAPGLVATLLVAMAHEHERAAGSWHAEWRPFTELLRSTGSAAAWLRTCLEELEVDARAMRENLDITGGLLLAERVSTELAPELGRMEAHEAVERAAAQAAATQGGFAAALSGQPEIRDRIPEERLAELLDPAGYLGSTDGFIDRALAAHDAREASA
jgi:3-carboxy-cis,cis-muconate cycloisomerase